MILILMVDDHNGYCFNHRRQSRDKIQRLHLYQQLNHKPLHMHAYSTNLYAKEYPNCTVEQITDECIYLCEIEDYHHYIGLCNEVWIYRWNRSYPYDFKLSIDIFNQFKLKYKESFKGSSHDQIDFEVYKL